MEEKWIAYLDDNYGIREYIENYDDVSFKTNSHLFAKLITEDEKKRINKVLRKNNRKNAKFVRLSKFDMVSYSALNALRERNYDYDGVRNNPAQWSRREDPLSLECIRFAKEEDLTDIETFKDFGEVVAKKYEKESPSE